MSVYKVVNKFHTRSTIREEPAVDSKGNVYAMIHTGAPLRYEVGDFIEDLTPDELKAFPDRFQLVESIPEGYRRVDGSVMPAQAPAARRLNPELMAMVRRAHSGDATKDEEALVSDVLIFVEKYMAGTTTPAECDAMAMKLADFDMELYA